MGPLTVLDTDVLVDHFRGLKEATSYIESLRVGQRSTTDITVMELFKGAVNQEELSLIDRFLNRSRFVVLPVSESASRQAVQILKRYALSHGLGIPDALIAAIVLEADSALVTGNMRHFDFIDHLTAIRPPYRP